MLKNKTRSVNRFAAKEKAVKRGGVYSHIDVNNLNLKEEYPFRLNFYIRPPPKEVTLEEFEGFALDRLQVLRAIETASLRNKDIKTEIQKTVEEYLPLKTNSSKSDSLYEERRKDHVSHFVLRMAYCRSEDLQAWFIKQECALFKYRFEQETQEEKKNFLEHLNLNWKILSREEKEAMRQELEICSKPKQGISIQDFISNETFFEVNFEMVPQLVGQRGVYIKKGKAYVPMSDQINIVMLEYKRRLETSLENISKLLPRLEEDERIKPILLNVEKQYLGRTYNETSHTSGTIEAQDVDSYVQRHAPLCMKNLNDSLKHDKHLKHFGRLQYGLFLKGIGLSVEQALVFWRTAFSNITDDKFQKEYAYNVRYNYGLEGRRTDYNPYSCTKIITSNPPSTGDNHGCPFRHFSLQNLEARLLKDQISRSNVDQILELSRNKHYQLACTKHYEVTHPQQKEKMDAIEHPNQYYEASKKLELENTTTTNNNEENPTQDTLEDSMDIDE